MVVHFLNGVIQSNRVDSIYQDLTKTIINSETYSYSELPYISRGDGTINSIMGSIDDSVAKTFTDKELPNKEVVRKVLRLWK